MELEKRIAVITGATGGLGRAVAARLAAAGAQLALVGTNAERLERLVHELGLPPRPLADLRGRSPHGERRGDGGPGGDREV